MDITQIICKRNQTQALLDELKDWQGEGAKVFLSGATTKGKHGYIIVKWDKPMPEMFHQKLMNDPDILDYFTLGSAVVTQLSQGL